MQWSSLGILGCNLDGRDGWLDGKLESTHHCPPGAGVGQVEEVAPVELQVVSAWSKVLKKLNWSN